MNRYCRVAVAALGLAGAGALAAPPAQPIVLQGLDCRGDEAPWRLDANRTSAVFSTTLPRKREVVFRGGMQTLGPSSVVWRGDSTHLPKETVVLTAHEQACRNPAAGTYRAVLSIRPNEALAGCCVIRAGYDARVAPVANLAAKSDWSRALPDLLPAINACLGREGSRAQTVIGATASGSTVRVRLKEGSGAVDCTIDASGRGKPAIVPADAAPQSGPLFYPARDPPPIVSCGTLERVQLRGSSIAGYLHYEPC